MGTLLCQSVHIPMFSQYIQNVRKKIRHQQNICIFDRNSRVFIKFEALYKFYNSQMKSTVFEWKPNRKAEINRIFWRSSVPRFGVTAEFRKVLQVSKQSETPQKAILGQRPSLNP